MKTLILALILTLSLVFITNAYRMRSNNALQEQLLDHLIKAERQNSIDQSQKELRKQLQRYEKGLFSDEESDDNDDNERTYALRKAVGLGDNPFK